MSVASALPRGRDAANSLMVDTATVTRAGEATFNPSTGLLEPGAPTTVYTGVCRLRQPTAQEVDVLFGEQQVAISRYVVTFPFDAAGIVRGDLITFTGSEAVEVVDRVFTVTRVDVATFTLYRLVACEEVIG